jgi:2-isopropylmalate synthase
VAHSRLKIQVACAGRTLVSDIEPIADIMQKTGVPVEAHLFIGSSMIRRYTEDWDLSRLLRHTEEAMSFCHAHGVSAMYVTEDTTRAEPEIIAKLFTTAIECGARRVCVSDTVGYSTPDGILNLIEFVRLVIRETGEDVKIDWHGHDDRGLGLCNALVAAIDARVDRIHGTCLGIGERAGNASIDQIIVNLFLMGFYDNDLSKLAEYCRFVAEVYGVPIPDHYPAVGRDAFRTSTGVHAAAIVKAFDKGDGPELADYVYSSVPAHALGLEQLIEIGPVSGRSNIIHCLKKKGYEPTEALVERILQHAKQADHILTDDELERLVASAG